MEKKVRFLGSALDVGPDRAPRLEKAGSRLGSPLPGERLYLRVPRDTKAEGSFFWAMAVVLLCIAGWLYFF